MHPYRQPSPIPTQPNDKVATRRRQWIYAAVVLVGVLAILITTVIGVTNKEEVSGAALAAPSTAGIHLEPPNIPILKIPTEVPGWTHGQPITAAHLATVSPETFFWTVYKRQSMIPVIDITREGHLAPAGESLARYRKKLPYFNHVNRVSFNYHTREFARAITHVTDGKVDGAAICVDNQEYRKLEKDIQSGAPYRPPRKPVDPDCPLIYDDAAYRQRSLLVTYIGDGFIPGGLTSQQADRFISRLQDRKLVSVKSISIVHAAGRTFVAMEGELNRIDSRIANDVDRAGIGEYRYCFSEMTGVSPDKYHLPSVYGGLQGLKWVYYLDPSTLQPTYSKQETTPAIRDDGSVSPKNQDYSEAIALFSWRFPPSVPKFTVADGDPPPHVGWPAGLPGS